jgi:hypothetical protein
MYKHSFFHVSPVLCKWHCAQVVHKMFAEVAAVQGISRVLYDLTSKPPGTTEWEWCPSRHDVWNWLSSLDCASIPSVTRLAVNTLSIKLVFRRRVNAIAVRHRGTNLFFVNYEDVTFSFIPLLFGCYNNNGFYHIYTFINYFLSVKVFCNQNCC